MVENRASMVRTVRTETRRQEWLSPEQRERIIDFYVERFGAPREIFSGRSMYLSSRQRVYLVADMLAKCSIEVVTGINVARVAAAVKPTTDFLQLHSAAIAKNVLELTTEQARKYIAGEELDESELALDRYTNGYLCLKYAGQALGCAHLKNGILSNMLAKDRRRKLEHL